MNPPAPRDLPSMENAKEILQHVSGLHSDISEMRTEIGHLRDGQQRVESGMRMETKEIRQFIRTEITDLKSEQIGDMRENIRRLWQVVDDLRKRDERRSGKTEGTVGLLHWIFAAGGLLVGAIGIALSLKGLK